MSIPQFDYFSEIVGFPLPLSTPLLTLRLPGNPTTRQPGNPATPGPSTYRLATSYPGRCRRCSLQSTYASHYPRLSITSCANAFSPSGVSLTRSLFTALIPAQIGWDSNQLRLNLTKNRPCMYKFIWQLCQWFYPVSCVECYACRQFCSQQLHLPLVSRLLHSESSFVSARSFR